MLVMVVCFIAFRWIHLSTPLIRLVLLLLVLLFFFSSRRRHTRFDCDWSSDVCSSDLPALRGRGSCFAFSFRRRPKWYMNQVSLRASPGGSTAFWCHCRRRCVLVKHPSFSACPAAGRRKTSVPISSGFSSPRSTSGESCQKEAVSSSTRSRTTSHFNLASALRSTRELGPATAGFCPITNRPSILPSNISRK